MSEVISCTVGQAVLRFLAAQYTVRDGIERPLFAGVLGIFGHGNVAGFGQALLQAEQHAQPGLPYVLSRNEQAAVHLAVGYARQTNRLQTWAVTTSIGPGATNLVTGAALATTNRIPVLLLPADTFATRVASPVLQELERPDSGDVSVNDALRPVSRFFDRVQRPEQLAAALLGAMRVLTDPAETGAVTIALPQDVQAEAGEWPVALFAKRVWPVPRSRADTSALDHAATLIKHAKQPMIVAGGGVHYSGAEAALAALCEQTGIPVGQTQAGMGSLLDGHPQLLGAIGATGCATANAYAHQADVVIGVGTRWSDFTTASRTAFAHPQVRFINLNVAAFDAGKHSGLSVVGDARESLVELARRLDPATAHTHTHEALSHKEQPRRAPDGPLDQRFVIEALNALADPRDVVVAAAGSLPGDLHQLWRVRDHKGYHVEYAFSCMGYEIAAGIGVRLAAQDRDVFVMVGDGSYLMMPAELVVAVQERVKIICVLIQNHGFRSIGALSRSVGSQGFATQYSYRDSDEPLPVDLAANAASLGAQVLRAATPEQFEQAVRTAEAAPDDGGPIVIHVDIGADVPTPDSDSWWDVPISAISELDSTRAARTEYERTKAHQRSYLDPATKETP